MKNVCLKKKNGFTMIEVLISLAIVSIIAVISGFTLRDIINSATRQNNIASTEFETNLGLEIMRVDVGNGGYGLADTDIDKITYDEASDPPGSLPRFSDGGSIIPRAFAHSNDQGGEVSAYNYVPKSDYLVVKSPLVGMNKACGRWSFITKTDGVHIWDASHPGNDMDFETGDRVVIVQTVEDGKKTKLITSGSSYMFTKGAAWPVPTGDTERYAVFGVDHDKDIKMPFNRADYAVRLDPSNTKCAPGTGNLEKNVINQNGGGLTRYKLLECVANMQVTFLINQGGAEGAAADKLIDDLEKLRNPSETKIDAMKLKSQIKEVRVFVLAHEGRKDKSFTYGGPSVVHLGDNSTVGEDVSLASYGTDWKNYRWKVYSFAVRPRTLTK